MITIKLTDAEKASIDNAKHYRHWTPNAGWPGEMRIYLCGYKAPLASEPTTNGKCPTCLMKGGWS